MTKYFLVIGKYNNRNYIYYIVIFLVFIYFSLPLYARSYKTTGYGNTSVEAKNDALARLSSDIMINVNSSQRVFLEENINHGKQLVSSFTDVTSSVDLKGVHYIDFGETKNDEKKLGKYYCIVELSDEYVGVYLNDAQDIANKIDEYYLLSLSETSLQALDSIYSEIKNLMFEYESKEQIINLIGENIVIPKYDKDISYVSIDYKQKVVRDQMISGVKRQANTPFEQISDIENRLKERIWQNSNKKNIDSNKTTNLGKSSSIELEYSKKYAIGDVGPAGGIIFYDKENTDDGWRYLEVSTSDISGKFIFGKNAKVSTSDKLGDGLANTFSIVDKNKSLNEYAALLCSNFNEGGYTDWYLPNKNEFKILISNIDRIKLRNSFKNDNYWTSSMLSNSYAWGYSFNTKKFFNDNLSTKQYIRPIRRF